MVSYTRFVESLPMALAPLCAYLQQRLGQPTGIAFIDSTPLPVCHNKRIARHKVFDGLATRGKSSYGWFYGFKLHLIVNELGEVVTFHLTPGNVDARKPMPQMAQRLWGKLVGATGYLSQPLFEQLLAHGVQRITPLRKNMSHRLMPLPDKRLARKRP